MTTICRVYCTQAATQLILYVREQTQQKERTYRCESNQDGTAESSRNRMRLKSCPIAASTSEPVGLFLYQYELDGTDLRFFNLGAKRNALIEGIAAARLKTLAVFVRFCTAVKLLRDDIAGGVEGGVPVYVKLRNCVRRLFSSDSQAMTISDCMERHFPAICGFQMCTAKNCSMRKPNDTKTADWESRIPFCSLPGLRALGPL